MRQLFGTAVKMDMYACVYSPRLVDQISFLNFWPFWVATEHELWLIFLDGDVVSPEPLTKTG